MALETSTYIDGLVPTNPLGSDPLADADGHLRLIKSTLKATFPNISGPVTASQDDLNSPFPAGGIIMWSGSIASIPSGWVLCDGDNSTPDLRDRFVVGAGLGYSVGDTGGSAQVALTEAQMPTHTHSFSGTGSTDSAGAHTHTSSYTDRYTSAATAVNTGIVGTVGIPSSGNSSSVRTGGGDGGTTGLYFTGATATKSLTTDSAGAHTHTVSVSGTVGETGSGEAHENRPPYYALAYIMKV